MSLKEPSEESVFQPHIEDSLDNFDLSRPKDHLVVQSKTSIQLPIPPSDVTNQKKHGDTRPIPSVEHLPPERNQSEISAEEHSSPSSSQPAFIESILNIAQNGFVFWRRVLSDSFRWQIFKSLLLLAAGLKMFKEYYKVVNSTERPPTDINDKEAWVKRCKKSKEREKILRNSTAK